MNVGVSEAVLGGVYCLTESFIAQCRPREVIIVQSAIFGRMHIGRCVAKNYGHLRPTVIRPWACPDVRHPAVELPEPTVIWECLDFRQSVVNKLRSSQNYTIVCQGVSKREAFC